MKTINILVCMLSFCFGLACIFIGAGLYFSDAFSGFGDKGIFLWLYLSIGLLFAFISFKIEKLLKVQFLAMMILFVFWGGYLTTFSLKYGVNNKYALLCAVPFVVIILKVFMHKK